MGGDGWMIGGLKSWMVEGVEVIGVDGVDGVTVWVDG